MESSSVVSVGGHCSFTRRCRWPQRSGARSSNSSGGEAAGLSIRASSWCTDRTHSVRSMLLRSAASPGTSANVARGTEPTPRCSSPARPLGKRRPFRASARPSVGAAHMGSRWRRKAALSSRTSAGDDAGREEVGLDERPVDLMSVDGPRRGRVACTMRSVPCGSEVFPDAWLRPARVALEEARLPAGRAAVPARVD